jgi:hypothetical protein
VSPKLQLILGESLQRRELEFAKRQILDELGLEVSIPLLDDNDDIAVRELELAIKDGKTFPSTKRMAELAQSLVDVDFRDNDLALLSYLEQEELIFRAIEKIIVN